MFKTIVSLAHFYAIGPTPTNTCFHGHMLLNLTTGSTPPITLEWRYTGLSGTHDLAPPLLQQTNSPCTLVMSSILTSSTILLSWSCLFLLQQTNSHHTSLTAELVLWGISPTRCPQEKWHNFDIPSLNKVKPHSKIIFPGPTYFSWCRWPKKVPTFFSRFQLTACLGGFYLWSPSC